MEYLKLNNLICNKYKITCTLENNYCYGVFTFDKTSKNELLYMLAGINDNNNTCLYNGKSVYENKEYSMNRVYLDFKKKYFRTLNIEAISLTFKQRFGLDFNKESFKEAVNTSNLRSEVLVTDEYKFTDYGINVCGYCLLKGLNFKNIIINNPLNNTRNENIKKLIVSTVTNKNKYSSIIVDINNPLDYKDLVDRYIILGDYENVIVCNPLKDKFLITDDNIALKNKIFKRGNVVICKLDENYDKKELRSLKQKIDIISFYDIFKTFIGDRI